MILGDARSLADLGRHFGALLYEAEARYLREHEWAKHADDVLIRRTKQALHMTPEERQAFTDWFDGVPARTSEGAA